MNLSTCGTNIYYLDRMVCDMFAHVYVKLMRVLEDLCRKKIELAVPQCYSTILVSGRLYVVRTLLIPTGTYADAYIYSCPWDLKLELTNVMPDVKMCDPIAPINSRSVFVNT